MFLQKLLLAICLLVFIIGIVLGNENFIVQETKDILNQTVSKSDENGKSNKENKQLSAFSRLSGLTSLSPRQVFKSAFTPAIYAASLVVGVIAMLAFYESPVSPMPIPPLPDPPVGRFPPEYPLPPKTHQQLSSQYHQQQQQQLEHNRRNFVSYHDHNYRKHHVGIKRN